jgi:hypothetical protein
VIQGDTTQELRNTFRVMLRKIGDLALTSVVKPLSQFQCYAVDTVIQYTTDNLAISRDMSRHLCIDDKIGVSSP